MCRLWPFRPFPDLSSVGGRVNSQNAIYLFELSVLFETDESGGFCRRKDAWDGRQGEKSDDHSRGPKASPVHIACARITEAHERIARHFPMPFDRLHAVDFFFPPTPAPLFFRGCYRRTGAATQTWCWPHRIILQLFLRLTGRDAGLTRRMDNVNGLLPLGVSVARECVCWCPAQLSGGGSVLIVMRGRSSMNIDHRIPTMPGRSTSGIHRPGRHRLHQERSAVRCWASRMKGEQHPTKKRL